MKPAEKVMIACLLISQGGEDEAVKEFVSVLAEGIEDGEQDSIDLHAALMARMKGPLPEGPAGEIIRLLCAKMEFDETRKKYGMVMSGMEKVLAILNSPAQTEFAARILVRRALDAAGEIKKSISS